MYLVIDTETSKAPNHYPWHKDSYLSLVALVTSDGERTWWAITHREAILKPTKQIVQEIQNYVDKADYIAGWNCKFDFHWLKHIGVTWNKTYDGMVAEYLINGQDREIPINLADTAIRYTVQQKIDKVKKFWDAGIDTANIPLEILAEYCIGDCVTTMEILKKQLPKIQELGLTRLNHLHQAFVTCLHEIEWNGFTVDQKFLAEQTVVYKEKLDAIEKNMRECVYSYFPELVPCEFNPNSGEHLSAVLYGGKIKYVGKEWVEKERKDGTVRRYERNCDAWIETKGFGIKPLKGIAAAKEGFYKTNKETLKQLRPRTKDAKAFLELISEQAQVSKIYTTYLVGMAEHLQSDGKIHAGFNQCFTVTGRLSSSKPNLQNLPRGGTDTVAKRLFIASDSDRVIMNGDLGALEWVAASVLCNDPVMQEEIIAGIDIHTANSIAIFGDTEHRQESKVTSFRALYGGSAYAFFADPNMPDFSLERWEEIHQEFYKKYKGLGAWQDKNYQLVCKQGWLQNPTGRLFKFKKVRKSDGTSSYNKPDVCNYPVQSFATADVAPLCMMVVRKQLLDKNLDAKMLGQVHDSIILDVHKKDVDVVAELIYNVFIGLPKYIESYFKINCPVPFTGEVECGPNYKEQQLLFGKKGRVAYYSDLKWDTKEV